MTNFDTSNMTAAELKEWANKLGREASDRARAEQKAKREARMAKQAADQKDHCGRMFTEVGQPLAGLNEAQHSAVYAMAWEQGHAFGYEEVPMYYGDFAELARKIVDLA